MTLKECRLYIYGRVSILSRNKQTICLLERPSIVKSQIRKGRSQVRGSEAASRVGEQVYHTSQGQDERARPRSPHFLRGLDLAWCGGSNPHRESGTRWR